MQNSRFVVLTGHLSDYPLPDLVGILRHQRKTGRLLIDYPKVPATFYFHDGELVDVQHGSVSGLQAICVALSQPASPFNFNPLMRPSRRSIESSLQRVVAEMFGCWDESPLEIESSTNGEPLPEPVSIGVAPALPAAPAEVHGLEIRALPAYAEPLTTQTRAILVMTAAGLMMLGLSSVIAITGALRGSAKSVAPAASQAASKSSALTDFAGQQQQSSRPEPRVNSTVEKPVSKPKDVVSASEQNRRREDAVTLINQMSSNKAETPSNTNGTTVPSAEGANKLKEPDTNYQSVDVIMQIENGRVLQAAVSNHKSGMDGYEAMALRIARQRRYSAATNGQQTIKIKVAQPNQD